MDKYLDNVFEYIDAIASKLGVASEHVYGVMVTQKIVSGWAQVIGSVVAILIVIATLYTLYKMHSGRKYNTVKHGTGEYKLLYEEVPANIWAKIYEALDDYEIMWVAIVASVMITIIGTVAVISCLFTGLMQVINPEYYVIKEILAILGGE